MPAKLAARVRLFDTGHNRKTDALDAHSIAVVAVRTPGLRVLAADGELEALRMLTDRRDELAHLRVQTVNRLQRLLSELIPGQRKRDLSALQAKAMLATVRPRDIAGKTRRRMAAEELADLVAVDAKLKKIKAELKAAVSDRGSTLMDIHGVGPAGAARILADVGDVARFADRNRFASWTGTAPLDASSGEQIRHRLSRAGNRRMNHVLHIAAIVQIRHDTAGGPTTDASSPPGRPRWKPCAASNDGSPTSSTAGWSPTPNAAPAPTLTRAREGTAGRLIESSAADLPPHIDTSDQPLPGPAPPTLLPTTRPGRPANSPQARPLTQRGARSGRSGGTGYADAVGVRLRTPCRGGAAARSPRRRTRQTPPAPRGPTPPTPTL